MHFLLYTKIGEEAIRDHLGLPEYSYYFVYRGFKSTFEELGMVTSVHSESEIIDTYDRMVSKGEDCIVVFFCPPHVAPVIHPRKAFCVLAWEFDTIPNEIWDDDPRNDWHYVFNRHLGLICLSSYTQAVAQKAMGADFPVRHIPVPVWEQFPLKERPIGDYSENQCITIVGKVIDSRSYHITPDLFEFKDGCGDTSLPFWDGRKIELVFNQDRRDSALLAGCYHAEAWGTWSRLARPWIYLECMIQGRFVLDLKIRGFGPTIGKTITVSIGGIERRFMLNEAPTHYRLEFERVPPSYRILITGIDTAPHGYAQDPRTMAVGFERLTLSSMDKAEMEAKSDLPHKMMVDLSGVIYTTVFNPADARKHWHDIVTAFCYAFRNNEDVTLILKNTHHDVKSIMGKFHFLLQQIGETKCRVIVIHGFLPDEDYRKLILATGYYVNASSGEGLCLPLMEFMANGVPAIAPDHTAIADYVDESTSWLLDYSRSLDIWPHDPRVKKRAISYEIHWRSLVNQFKNSYQCITQEENLYKRKAMASIQKIRNLANGKRVKDNVRSFLKEIVRD